MYKVHIKCYFLYRCIWRYQNRGLLQFRRVFPCNCQNRNGTPGCIHGGAGTCQLLVCSEFAYSWSLLPYKTGGGTGIITTCTGIMFYIYTACCVDIRLLLFGFYLKLKKCPLRRLLISYSDICVYSSLMVLSKLGYLKPLCHYVDINRWHSTQRSLHGSPGITWTNVKQSGLY